MKVIDNSYPVTFGGIYEGECFKRSDDKSGKIYMKIHPFTINSYPKVNAIIFSTATLVYLEDYDEIIPVKGIVTIENY